MELTLQELVDFRIGHTAMFYRNMNKYEYDNGADSKIALFAYLSELIRHRLQHGVSLVAICARFQVLVLAQHEIGAQRSDQPVVNLTGARHVRLDARIVDVKATHRVLQHGQQTLLEVQRPNGFGGVGAHLFDDAIVVGKSVVLQFRIVLKG